MDQDPIGQLPGDGLRAVCAGRVHDHEHLVREANRRDALGEVTLLVAGGNQGCQFLATHDFEIVPPGADRQKRKDAPNRPQTTKSPLHWDTDPLHDQ